MQFNEIDNSGIKNFSQNLLKNRHLTSLDLTGNRINERGMYHLAESLKYNNSLKSLSLYKNELDCESIKHLSEALFCNSCLELLNVGCNKVYQKGIQYLSESLKHNDSLHSLYLRNTNLNEVSLNSLLDSLKINRSLRCILIDSSIYQKKIDFFISANNKWNPKTHFQESQPFRASISTFILSLRRKEYDYQIKIPKCIKFLIIKHIDRKAFFHHLFPQNYEINIKFHLPSSISRISKRQTYYLKSKFKSNQSEIKKKINL